MKDVAPYARLMYLDGLKPLQVNGISIPVADEDLPAGTKPAVINGGKAYVILRDQQEVPSNFNKCGIIQDCSITLEVITKFPLGSGGKITSELISNAIQQLVNPFKGEYLTIDPQFNLLSITKEMSQGLTEYSDTETVYRKIIIYNNTINEK